MGKAGCQIKLSCLKSFTAKVVGKLKNDKKKNNILERKHGYKNGNTTSV